MQFVNTAQFRRLARAGATAGVAVMRSGTVAQRAWDGVSRRIRFVFSDASVDRQGDTIAVGGWLLDNFLRNPVALWNHDGLAPPIGRASNVGTSGGKLIGDIEFMPPEVSSFADSIFKMVKERFINAVSVGFRPIEWTFASDPKRPGGIDFKRQELLEISVCPVPANAGALAAEQRGLRNGGSDARRRGRMAEAARVREVQRLMDCGISLDVAELLAAKGRS
jgi:HK97 family phage prohead protease